MKIHTEKSEKLWNTAEKWLWWEESIGFSHSQTHLRLKELPPWHILLDWTGRCLSLAFSAILPVLQQLHTNFQRKSTNFTFILCTQWSKIKLSILQQQGIRPISIQTWYLSKLLPDRSFRGQNFTQKRVNWNSDKFATKQREFTKDV